MPPVNPKIKPGLYAGIPDDDYHGGPGYSNSQFSTVIDQSPAHMKFAPKREAKHFDFGKANHMAIFQPDEFEKKVVRGPEDRRGNKWKDAEEVAILDKKLLLTAPDYDATLTIRDTIHANAWVNSIITGGKPEVEYSGYWKDPETGLLLRNRPDLYRRDLGVIVDGKSTRSAHPDAFARSVISYGYHRQEFTYTDGHRALGNTVDAFVFLTWESTPPYLFAVYELPPKIVEDGRIDILKARATVAACEKSGRWPGYDAGEPVELEFKPYHYKNTSPDERDDNA